MDQYEYIRTAHRVYGKSIRQIQKDTGHARVTIRKVLNGELPAYKRRGRQTCPVLEAHRETIERWLKEDLESPKKQRHTARRIYNRLVEEEGFKGSEVNVRRYVRLAKARLGSSSSGVFLILDPDCGREAEADWGRGTAVIRGVKTPIHFFCMRSRFSGKHFVRAYPCEKQEAFFDAHIHAFAFFGGVFSTVVYDNLTSAVQKVLQGRQRIEQEGFRRFRAYYNFEPRFCNPGCGHEKGGTEGAVGYVRRNYMVPMPVVESFGELNQKLLASCLRYGEHRMAGRADTVDVLFEREREHLIHLPAVPFSNMRVLEARVNKYATVMVDKNHYSVPIPYAGLTLRVQISIDRLEIFYEGRKIASHERLFGNNKWQLDPQHYLELIRRKPGAFDSALVIRQWRPAWPPCLERLLERFKEKQGETAGIKDFIAVLMFYRDHAAEDVEAAAEMALDHHIANSEGIRHILVYSGPEDTFAPLAGWPATLVPDVAIYGALGVIR
ncbi:MAG: IS21 family transposase [Candidatus Atribacteria bacterium]|nr:IS21 family transposase [Candidatus Atribacteria bacterium]